MKRKISLSICLVGLLYLSSIALAVDSSTDELVQMSVNFPGMTNVHTSAYIPDGSDGTVGDDRVVSMNWQDDQAVLEVPSGIYDIKLKRGSSSHIIDNIDCSSGSCNVDILIVDLIVDFPGMDSVHTDARIPDGVTGIAGGEEVTKQNWKRDQAILKVFPQVYDVRIRKGGATQIVDNVDCRSGSCIVNNLVVDLIVDFPGMESVHTDARVPDDETGIAGGAEVTKQNWKRDQAILKVFPQVYDVRLRKGGATQIVDNVDCRSGSCSVNNLVVDLIVDFPGMDSVHSDARIPDGETGIAGGEEVTKQNWKRDQAILKVFPQVYDVRLRKGGATQIVDNVDCRSGSCSVNNLVVDLIVDFPGMESVHTDARIPDGEAGIAGGEEITKQNWKRDQAILKVFPQVYDVRLRKGGATHIIDNVDCRSGSCNVNNLVVDLIVDFPGMASVHTDARIPDGVIGVAEGAEITKQNWKNDQAILKVFPQVYDVRLRKSESTLIVDNVDCSSGFCTVGNVTATMIVRFPGLSSMHSSVHLPDLLSAQATGSIVTKANWKTHQAEMIVLRQTYDVSLKQQGENDTLIFDNVDCTSSTCDVLFEGNAHVVLIDGDANTPIAGQLLSVYEKFSDGSLSLSKKGSTYTQGNVNFNLPGLGAGRTYVIKTSNPFGNGNQYYSPFITQTGFLEFIVTRGGENTLDLVPPEVSISSPQDNSNVSSDGFQITGMADDNREINSITIMIQQANDTINLDAQYDSGSKQWVVEVDASSFAINTSILLTVLASDHAGNQASTSISIIPIMDDAGPIINITSHQNNDDVPATGFLLSGVVSDLTGVESLTASLIDPRLGTTIDNEIVSFSSQSGNWTLAVQNGQISENELISITMNAIDVDGNSSELEMNFNAKSVDNSGRHLLNRITFGSTPLLLQQMQNLGVQAFLEQQLNPSQIDDSELSSRLAGLNPVTKEELQSWTVLHMIYSKRQLLEVMTWFWDNHFNTDIDVKRRNADDVTISNEVTYELRENVAFRNNALGNFRELLDISAKSPSMLIYLDSISNVAGDSNENYAREVLELHTLGVDGGFLHHDVEAGAEIFTGWHLRNGNFYFDASRHNAESHIVLGTEIPVAGEVQGDYFLDIIAAHRSTAAFICSKLVTLFVSDTPVSSLNERCANQFFDSLNDTDQIAQVLRVILTSPEFFNQENYRSKIKTPLEFVVGAVRNLDVETDASDLPNAIRSMGIDLYNNPVPTGWSEVGEDWINSSLLIERIKWVNQLTRASNQNAPDLLTFFPAYGYETAAGIVGFMLSLSIGDSYTDFSSQQALELLNGTGQFDLNNVDARERLNQFSGAVMSYPQYQFQ